MDRKEVMSLHQLAREAAFVLHGFHIVSSVGWVVPLQVVKPEANTYAKYLRTHVLQGR